MDAPDDPLSTEAITRALSDIPFVRRIEYLPTVGSTNDVARQLGAEGAPEATLVIADEQTAGRGRLGRAWWTPPGTAIAMSLLLRPRFPPSLAYRLTMLAGLVTAEAVEQVTGLKVGLKWPNDIVITRSGIGNRKSEVGGRKSEVGSRKSEVRGRKSEIGGRRSEAILKLGGILTETSISGEALEFAIVGVGLNVNVDFRGRTDLPEATSLMAQLGHKVERLGILRALVEQFAARYAVIESDERLRDDWSARLITLGRQIVAHCGQESIMGQAESVDEFGALLIRQDDGTLRRVDAADVTLRDARSPHRSGYGYRRLGG